MKQKKRDLQIYNNTANITLHKRKEQDKKKKD